MEQCEERQGRVRGNMGIKRMRALCLAGAACFAAASLLGCQSAKEEQEQFDAFLQSEFVNWMESEYTAIHVYLQDPEQYGVDIKQVPAGLGTRPDEAGMEAQKEAGKASYDALKQFDRDLLTETQQDIYDSYEWQLELEQEAADDRFAYYESLFGSMTGIHYQIPTLLADWELRKEEDVADLIAVVEDVKPYVESALDYTEKQEEKGLLMLDLDSVIQYCDSILKKGEDSSILQSMSDSVDKLGLDAETADSYKKQLKTAFCESVLPAYEAIRDAMTAYQTGTNNEEGLAAFAHGKEYFEILLKQNIGSDQSVEEIREWMEDELQEHMGNMIAMMSQNPSLLERVYSETSYPETDYTDYYIMMDDIKGQMFEDFPEVGQLDYVIEEVNEEIASDSGVTAYFNIPTLDGDPVKQLRVNPKTNDLSSLSTYQTVAHEGFPGHMYQYAYMYENLDTPFQKTVLNSNAYAEGYATYAQYEANRYLRDLDQELLEVYKENDLISNSMVILVDIGIHYEGWSMEETADYMTELGFAMEGEGIEGIYRQLQANPCAFEPYYVGYFEIENLKEKAQEALGDQFENKGFNEALLKSGLVSFSVVERNVDAYIEEAEDVE